MGNSSQLRRAAAPPSAEQVKTWQTAFVPIAVEALQHLFGDLGPEPRTEEGMEGAKPRRGSAHLRDGTESSGTQ